MTDGHKTTPPSIPLAYQPSYADDELRRRSVDFLELARQRRSVRDFDPRPVPRAVIENCLRAAGTAPSGANQQPWHFAAVADPARKRRIREAAEAEEREFYSHRATPEWLAALSPLDTGPEKPFLETAPWLIGVFVQRWHDDAAGERHKHYCALESVGIATGLLITALHQAGLACLTHTPSPMGFLNELLARPEAERPFLLLVTGHPAPDAHVPDLRRKDLGEFASFL